MLIRLLLIFILVPLVELMILIRIGAHIGAAPTVLLVLGIGMVGAWLARQEGFRAVGRIRLDLAEGRLPGDSTIDAVLVLVAGVLMIIPGLLSDVAGLLLLIPPIRAAARRWLKSRFQARFTITHLGPHGFHGGDVFRRSGFPDAPDYPRGRDDLIDVDARPHDDR